MRESSLIAQACDAFLFKVCKHLFKMVGNEDTDVFMKCFDRARAEVCQLVVSFILKKIFLVLQRDRRFTVINKKYVRLKIRF